MSPLSIPVDRNRHHPHAHRVHIALYGIDTVVFVLLMIGNLWWFGLFLVEFLVGEAVLKYGGTTAHACLGGEDCDTGDVNGTVYHGDHHHHVPAKLHTWTRYALLVDATLLALSTATLTWATWSVANGGLGDLYPAAVLAGLHLVGGLVWDLVHQRARLIDPSVYRERCVDGKAGTLAGSRFRETL